MANFVTRCRPSAHTYNIHWKSQSQKKSEESDNTNGVLYKYFYDIFVAEFQCIFTCIVEVLQNKNDERNMWVNPRYYFLWGHSYSANLVQSMNLS